MARFDADDRTPEQMDTHVYGIAGTDSLLSGWGKADGGTSVACWACTADDVDRVESWVRSRSDMKRVRFVALKDWRPRAAHVHVYTVTPGHPAVA